MLNTVTNAYTENGKPRQRVETLQDALDRIASIIETAEFAELAEKYLRGTERLEYTITIEHCKQGGFNVHLNAKQIARRINVATFLRLE